MSVVGPRSRRWVSARKRWHGTFEVISSMTDNEGVG